MLLDESYFDTFPKEVRHNKYVLIDMMGTKENFIDAYDSEIEAYKDYKKVSTKTKRIFKANVTYVKIGNRKYMYKYEEIQ